MIDYEPGAWGVGLICSKHGSVFPRALTWSTTSAIMAVVWCYAFRSIWGEDYPDVGGTSFTIVWGGFTFTVGFLLVFRTQIAFARFWEGATALWGVKGVWVNVVSNLLAFTTSDSSKSREVEAFQHFLVRLMSTLYSVSLESVSTVDTHFPTLGQDGISKEHLDYLENVHDKVEVVLNWVQRLIVENHHNGILSVPPPVLSRTFQELGNGIRELQGVRRIQTCPFPFPYAQAISLFLIINWVLLPMVAGFFIPQALSAAGMSFCTLFALAGINYIAVELEMPFGTDPNDLPLHELQDDFNACMRMLMHPRTRKRPTFTFDEEQHRASLQVQRSRSVPHGTDSSSKLSAFFHAPRSLRSQKKQQRRKQFATPPSEDPGPKDEVLQREVEAELSCRSSEVKPPAPWLDDLLRPPTTAHMSALSSVMAKMITRDEFEQTLPNERDEITTLAVVSAPDSGGQTSAVPVSTSLPTDSILSVRSTWGKGSSTACLVDNKFFVL
eukprot:TRINITY_DN8507_c0_g3_i2.p1 TRINITY_DN8507_c0_g3~~TRINITY_DN8507_c0_g3_i2.p1  ORF type:complete len:497 (-),score=47.25 TRINITY_DN8507_c0_g3_i2:368-1858(-)